METAETHGERVQEDAPKVSGFRAFTAQDWKRIETVGAATRQVGQMMLREGQELVVPTDRGSAVWDRFDVSIYARLCGELALPTCAPSADENDHPQARDGHKRKSQAKGKNTRREQAEKRLYDQERARVAALNGGLPRWETAAGKWEAYLAGFRVWARAAVDAAAAPAADRLISCCNLRELVSAYPVAETDLREDAAILSRGFTFSSLLELVAAREQLLVAPSFCPGRGGLQLYPEQREVAAAVLDCLRSRQALLIGGDRMSPPTLPALLLRFCTPPSTGKSSAAAYIGAVFEQFRRTEVAKAPRSGGRLDPTYILYECYSESVRFDVAKTCVAAGVPFAILTSCLACPSFACYHGRAPKKSGAPPVDCEERLLYSLKLMDSCDIRPAVLVADPDSAIKFLRLRSSLQQRSLGDVLLFDEPTAGVSEAISEAHAGIMAAAPALTVLMSATLPPFEAFPDTVAHLGVQHGSSLRCVDVRSNRIVSPCTVVDAQGDVFGPHRLFAGGCGRLCDLAEQYLHLLRLFSPRAVAQLVADASAASPASAAEVEALSVADACSFAAIRRAAMRVLRACDPDLCLATNLSTYATPTLRTLCTTGSHLLPGTSILLSEDEDAARQEALMPLLAGSERLAKRIQAHAAELERLSRLRLHEGPGRRASKEKESQLDRMRAEDALRSDYAPPPLWPSRLCVNSLEHLGTFAKGKPFDAALTRAVPHVPEDVLETSCEELVEGLLCGLCSLNSTSGDQTLTLASQTMAEGQSFSFLSGGRSAIFGINLPCDRVVLLLRADRTSPESIVQCLGRCGRTGKFTKSEVLFGSVELLKLVFEEQTLLLLGREDGQLDARVRRHLSPSVAA